MKATLALALLSSISSYLLLGALAQGGCGSNAGGATCAGGLCCSTSGFCGSTEAYCGPGNCQSQCPTSTPTPTPPTPTPTPSGGGGDLSSLIPESLFNEMLKHRTDTACQGGFFTYNAFITAAQSYPAFGTTGDTDTRKREIAAFFGQTSHETTGGYPAAPDGPYAWGYCFVQEKNPQSDYCGATTQYPCVTGKQYYGRGPIMLTLNVNYGQAGEGLNQNLLSNPDLVATDVVISFKTALWFWMTAQAPKPSCHSVITGQWTPSAADTSANRLPGYGLITNIINGGLECANLAEDKVQDRIGFYNRYCGLFAVSPGDNLDCANQTPYGP